MNTFKILFAVLCAFILNGCIIDQIFDCENGRGERVEEEFDLDDFDGVRLSTDADVFITQGSEHHLRIVAQQNIIDALEFKIRNKTLFIDTDHCIESYDNIEIYLSMEEVELLAILGSGGMVSENTLQFNDISLQISGSGNMDLGLEGDDIDARISGSGDMFLEGEADELDFRISGSGDLSAFGLEVRKADIQISGSGDAEVNVSDFLDVRISGSGDVLYVGDPDIESRVSGSGRVIDSN